jgi:copper transport protein
MLAQAVLVAPGDEDIVQALRGFTKHAPLFITIAVVSGMIQLYVLDGGAILTSRHGRLIVLKSIGVAAMVYLGMLTRQIVAARLTRARTVNARFAASLRRAVAAEAGFGVFVLALASWAVATLPKNIEPPGTDRTNYAFIGDRSGGAFDVQVKITPAKVGLNAVRLDLYSPDSGVTDLQVQFNPPTNNTASVTLMVPLDGKGAARLPMKEGIPFGIPGLWTVIVSGNGPGGPLPSVTYTVSVMSNDGEDLVVSTTQPATGVTVNSAVTVPMTALVPVGGSTTTPTGVAPVQQGIQPVTAATPSTQG